MISKTTVIGVWSWNSHYVMPSRVPRVVAYRAHLLCWQQVEREMLYHSVASLQDLCRARMATKTHQDKPEPIHVGQRIAGLSRESEVSNNSPSSRSSTSSWWVRNTAGSPLEFCDVWVAHNSDAKHSDRPEYDEQPLTFQRTIVPSTSGSSSWPAWPWSWKRSEYTNVKVFESLLRFCVCSWNAKNKTHNKLWAGDAHRVLDFVKVMSNDAV
jgi:hypothetical protein